MRLGTTFALCLVFILPVACEVNFTDCLLDFQDGLHGPLSAGRNNHGAPVNNFTDATALSYTYCRDTCGTSSEPFSWRTFSQQFSAWLLPWLALLSNLPFSAHDIVDDVRSMVLTVGSPMLAAYSLAITVMNHRWLTQLFAEFHKGEEKGHIETVIEVLGRLQQCPVTFLKLNWLKTSEALDSSNKPWWDNMLRKLRVSQTWSIAAATSVAWVVIAYIFTVVDSLTPMSDIDQSVNSAGQGVGSLWLWLLTIVVGWLQVSQKTTAENIAKAADKVQDGQIFIFRSRTARCPLRRDEHRIPPVFNYSRVLPWTADVLKVEAKFREVQHQRKIQHHASRSQASSATHVAPPDGTSADDYLLDDLKVRSIWESGVLPRMATASFFAFVLQWGTTGSAVVVSWFTPTVGLGCRSFSFLVYGAISTVIWLMFITSSLLTYVAVQKSRNHPGCSQTDKNEYDEYDDEENDGAARWQLRKDPLNWMIKKSAIGLRRIAKLLAWVNAAWIMTICFFQFTNFYDRCFCNSSVLGLGQQGGYIVIQYGPDDKRFVEKAWAGGVVIGLSSAGIFCMFIMLQLNPHIGY